MCVSFIKPAVISTLLVDFLLIDWSASLPLLLHLLLKHTKAITAHTMSSRKRAPAGKSVVVRFALSAWHEPGCEQSVGVKIDHVSCQQISFCKYLPLINTVGVWESIIEIIMPLKIRLGNLEAANNNATLYCTNCVIVAGLEEENF